MSKNKQKLMIEVFVLSSVMWNLVCVMYVEMV